MASFKFPLTVADKQKLLFVSPAPPPELTAWGRQYEAAGQFHDALDFYLGAKDSASIRSLLDKAVQAADLVLLLNAYRALDEEPDAQRVEALQAAAATAGKEAVAKKASLLLVKSP